MGVLGRDRPAARSSEGSTLSVSHDEDAVVFHSLPPGGGSLPTVDGWTPGDPSGDRSGRELRQEVSLKMGHRE